MDTIPGRLSIASPYRALLAGFEKLVPLLDINPSYYDTLAIGLSVLFLYTQTEWLKVLLITVILLTDWLDGATARRYNRVCRTGYVTDVVVDRLSEAFIFLAGLGTVLGQVFFLLWLVNVGLTFYSIYTNKHWSLPLRFVYMVILMIPVGNWP